MEDLHSQQEDVTGDASRSVASYLSMALVAAQKAADWRTRRTDRQTAADLLGTDGATAGTGQRTAAGTDTDTEAATDRAARDAMLSPDKGRRASSDTALQAWTAAQPWRADDPDADLVAGRAETRLRELHPDAMARYDALRAGLSPVEAMREVTPLITDGTAAGVAAQAPAPRAAEPTVEDVTGRSPGSPGGHPEAAAATPPLLAGAAGDRVQAPPEARYAPAVRGALDAELASAVLRDKSWPALANALHQAQRAGAEPTELLRDAAAERELTSAKSPARVLTHRLEQTGQRPPAGTAPRSPTAADVTTSSYPTPIAVATGPSRPGTDQALDLAAVGAALELAHRADTERHSARTAAGAPDDPLTRAVDEHQEGLTAAQRHTGRASADQSRAAALHADAGATAGPAATAARSYPVPVPQAPAAQGPQLRPPPGAARGPARPAAAAQRARGAR